MGTSRAMGGARLLVTLIYKMIRRDVKSRHGTIRKSA